MKRTKTRIFIIQNADGVWVSNQKDISEAGVQFYQSLFTSE